MSLRLYNAAPIGTKAAKVNTDLAALKKHGKQEDARHGSNNLSVPLVPLGGADDAEPTHLGGNTWAGDETLKETYQQADGNLWWLFDELGGRLLATNVAKSEQYTGESRSFDECMADVDLKRRVVAIEPE